MTMIVSTIQKRPILILFLGIILLWIVVEWYLFIGISHVLGLFPTLLLSIFKGGFGLLLLGGVLTRFGRLLRNKQSRKDIAAVEPFLAIFGAILICIPGFLCSLIGLALFIPAFRVIVSQAVKTRSTQGVIDLGKDDYHIER